MSNTDNLTISFLMVLSLNVIMFFIAHGLTDLGYASPFNTEDLLLNKFDGGNYTTPSDPQNLLPDTQAVGIDPEDNNVYTDIFTSARSWFLDITGIGYLLGLLDAPAVILIAIGLSASQAWAITALWYGLTLFFIVAFIFGR